MILKASQRGSAKQLARHLLNARYNEHVDIHEFRGFLSDDLTGALKEAQATASGTRCKQFLFSVSVNPPQGETVSISQFEEALQRIEERNGLQGQPRAIVFHEKEGRRHAHVVWSRIDARTMTTKNLPHFKRKLQDISCQLFIEHNWKMSKGLIKHGGRDPRNFTLAEWQQAKRIGLHAGDIEEMFQDCRANSDSSKAFAQALSERGFILARGDRRDFVAVSHTGDIRSLRSQTGKRVKDLLAKLGGGEDLPSVADAKKRLRQDLGQTFKRHIHETKAAFMLGAAHLETRRRPMTEMHRAERRQQKDGQDKRWQAEAQARAARLRSGLAGIWQFVTGSRKRIAEENAQQSLEALQRDRAEKEALNEAQLAERQKLQFDLVSLRRETARMLLKTRQDRSNMSKAMQPEEDVMKTRYEKKQRRRKTRQRRASNGPRRGPSLSL